MLKFKDTSFFSLFKIVGLETFNNWAFFWSGVIFLLLNISFCITNSYGQIHKLLDNIPTLLISISASIFSIIIAALAITITTFNKILLPKLLETKLLQKFLFPFWKAVSLWGISIMICLFIIIFNTLNVFNFLKYFLLFEIFIFTYATFYTISLTGDVIRHALQSAQIKSTD